MTSVGPKLVLLVVLVAVQGGLSYGAKYSQPSGCRYYCVYANSVYCCDNGSLTSKYTDMMTSRPLTQIRVNPTTDQVLQDEILYGKRFKDKNARLPDNKKLNTKKYNQFKNGVFSILDPGQFLSTLKDHGGKIEKRHALKRVKRVKRRAEEESTQKPESSKGLTNYESLRKRYLQLQRSSLNAPRSYNPHYPMFIQPFNPFQLMTPAMSHWFMNDHSLLPQLQDLRHFSLTPPQNLSLPSLPQPQNLGHVLLPQSQDLSHSEILRIQNVSPSPLTQLQDLSQSQLPQQQDLIHSPLPQSQNLRLPPLPQTQEIIQSQLSQQPDLSLSPPPQSQDLNQSHSLPPLPQVQSNPEIPKTNELTITRAVPSLELVIPGIKQDALSNNKNITEPRSLDANSNRDSTHTFTEIIFFNISDANESKSKQKMNTSLDVQSSNRIERFAAAPEFLDFSQLPPIPFPMKQRLPDLPLNTSSDTEVAIDDEIPKILVPAGPHLIGPVSNYFVGVPQASGLAFQNSLTYPAELGLHYTHSPFVPGEIHSLQGHMPFTLLNPNMHYGTNNFHYPSNNIAAGSLPLRRVYYNGNQLQGTKRRVSNPAFTSGYLGYPSNNLPGNNHVFFDQIVDHPVFSHPVPQESLALNALGNPLLQTQQPFTGFTAQLKRETVIENEEPLGRDNISEVRALFNVPPPLSPLAKEGFSFIDDSSKSHEISVVHQEVVHVMGMGDRKNTIQNDHSDRTLGTPIDQNPTSTVGVPIRTRADQFYGKVEDKRNQVQEHMTISSGHDTFNRASKEPEIIMGTPYIISEAGEVKRITVNFGDPALRAYERNPISSANLNTKPQSIRRHQTKRDEMSRTSGAQLHFPIKDFPPEVYELDDLPFQKLKGHKIVRTELDDLSFQKLRGQKIEITDHGRIAPNSQFTSGNIGHAKRHAISGGHSHGFQTQKQLFSLANHKDPKYDHSKYIRAVTLGESITVSEASKSHDKPEYITANHTPKRVISSYAAVKRQNFPRHSTLASRFDTFNKQRFDSDSLNSGPIPYATEISDQMSNSKYPEPPEFTSSHSLGPESNADQPTALMNYPENPFHLIEHAKPKSIAEQISVLEKICPCLNLPGAPFFQQRCRCPAVDKVVVAFRKHETDPYSILTYNDFIKKHLNQITPEHIILNNERPYFEEGNNGTPDRVNRRSDVTKKWLPTLPTKSPGSPVAQNHIEDMFLISIPKDERPTTFKLLQDGKDTSDIIDEKKLKPMKPAVEAFVKDLEQLLF